jgi:hypothetical protein
MAQKMLSQTGLYYVFIVGSVLCALGQFAYGVHICSKDDAVRGGAIPVLVSFLLLFLRRNYGERSFENFRVANPEIAKKLDEVAGTKNIPVFTQEENTKLSLGILSRMNVEAGEQKAQNIALFIASVIGTAILAFGDMLYKAIAT